MVGGDGTRRRHGRRCAWLAAAALLAAVGGPAAAAERPSTLVAAGERLLRARCGDCHAVTAGRPSPLAAAIPFDQLGGDYPPGHLAEALAEGIVSGHAGMPEVRLSPREIDAVLAYLEALTAPVPRRRPAGG
jgi:mono/diheme cytochrome c family protein